MQITIIAVGKIKEKYLKMAMDEYLKRLTTMAKVRIHEVADEKIPQNPSINQIKQLKDLEGKRITAALTDGSFHVMLDGNGENLSSEEFASFIEKKTLEGQSHFTFVIGGSLGLGEDVKNKADLLLSFGKMTFPHQLMRPLLLEQIYRALKIIRGENYHK